MTKATNQPEPTAPEELEGAIVEPAAEPVAEAATESVAETIDPKDQQITELTNDLQRTRADFENYRRQSESQREQYGKLMEQKTVKKILNLIDDFERAASVQPELMAPLMKNFEKTLKSLGLEKIDSAPGVAFDPEIHNATSVEGEGEEEIVLETQGAGYRYDGEVIRAAFVKVERR